MNMEETKSPEGQLTKRGRRTREALLAAARDVFERDGFLDARITDISSEAGVAHGTFYKYFSSKEDVFAEVIQRSQQRLHDTAPARTPGLTHYERILEVNTRYYAGYLERLRINDVMESVATFDETMREMRRSIRREYVDRTELAIRRWQEADKVYKDLDPHLTASALCSMVDRSIYVWLVLGEPHDPVTAVETLSRLWAHALGLETPHLPQTKTPA